MKEKPRKEEIITFKVDTALSDSMAGIRNRSEFIRHAILAALGNTCPLCNGTGTLSVAQMNHWQETLSHHHLEECGSCHEIHLVCEYEAAP